MRLHPTKPAYNVCVIRLASGRNLPNRERKMNHVGSPEGTGGTDLGSAVLRDSLLLKQAGPVPSFFGVEA